MARTPKKARKHATQPVPVLQAPPPMSQAPGTMTITRTHRIPRVEQSLDPPEFEGNVLTDIRTRWKTAGSLLPTPLESEKLLTAYKRAHTNVEAARKVLQDALTIETTTILDLARAFGGNSLRIDGVVHDFACRGELVFFRRKNVGIIDTDSK